MKKTDAKPIASVNPANGKLPTNSPGKNGLVPMPKPSKKVTNATNNYRLFYVPATILIWRHALSLPNLASKLLRKNELA